MLDQKIVESIMVLQVEAIYENSKERIEWTLTSRK